MIKTILLAIFFSLFPYRFAFAVDILGADAENQSLMPADAMEELLNRSGEEDSNQPSAYEFDDSQKTLPQKSRVLCIAKDQKGKRYDARGFGPRQVQEEAFKKCEKSSRHCFDVGCQKELYSTARH